MIETNDVVLSCQDLSRSYQLGPEKLAILQGLNLEVRRGEMISVMGASGSGKSTLLNILGGLDRPDSGSVKLAGTDLATVDETQAAALRNQHLGFVFQFHHLLPEFSAAENLAIPLMLRGTKRREALVEAVAMLDKLGISARAQHKPAELSGGERQRVAIARALIGRPDMLLMDEPTGNLDSRNAERVVELITELNSEFRIALVLVTHDASIAERMQRKLELRDGVLLATE